MIFQTAMQKKKEDFLKARKDRTSSSIKKKVIRNELDRLDSKYKRYGPGMMSPENYKDRFEYLYHKGMQMQEMKAVKSREAQKIKENDQMRGATFNPEINPKSQEIADKSELPGLEERTQQYVDRRRHSIQNRGKHTLPLGPNTDEYQVEILCRDSKADVSPIRRQASTSKKRKVVLAPEDWDNFYKKTSEWYQHKQKKKEWLEDQLKKRGTLWNSRN